MPTIDPMVVMRSARALDDYGPEFRYGHYLVTGGLGQVTGGAPVGIGTRGPGEQQLEIDRRLVNQRKAQLKSELSRIEGAALLIAFIAYDTYVVLQNVNMDG